MATCWSPFGAKRLDDLIRCPLCAKVLHSARVLPCSHTLCMRCIEELETQHSAVDEQSSADTDQPTCVGLFYSCNICL